MDSDEEEEKEKTKGPKFPIQMYISEGNKHLRLAKYDTAIEFFDAALEKEPNRVSSLIGRSKCKMRMAKFTEAREDAEAALKLNPKSSEAKMLIGEADYFLGDFEKGFLTFYRGHAARPNCGGLRLGHQMCRRAIENALKPDKRMIIKDKEVANLTKLEEAEDDEQTSELDSRKDLFSSDVDFVETLLNDDSVSSVHPQCEYLKMYLKDRQTFWRTQNPSTSARSALETDSNMKQRDEDDPHMAENSASQSENDTKGTASVAENMQSKDGVDPNMSESLVQQSEDAAKDIASDAENIEQKDEDGPNMNESSEMQEENVAQDTISNKENK